MRADGQLQVQLQPVLSFSDHFGLKHRFSSYPAPTLSRSSDYGTVFKFSFFSETTGSLRYTHDT